MPTIHKILVATDFSEHAAAALEYGAELAVKYAAPLLLVHVYANPVVSVPDGFVVMSAPNLAELLAQMGTGLRKAEARARDLGASPVETKLVEGTAWYEIIGAARAHDCDLIVLGTHGRGGLSHLLLGSVAEKVVRKAECAVLTVHLPRRQAGAGHAA